MPGLTNKKSHPTTKNTPASVADIVVRRSRQSKKKTPMLTAEIVPAGAYRSIILAVEEAHSDEGKLLADVSYRFTAADGKFAEARIRYPVPGFHLERLMDALIDAGLPEGASLTDAVGLEEEVTVAYAHEGALGKIKTRCPATQVAPIAAKKPVPKQTLPKNRKTLIEEEEVVEDFDEDFEFEEEDED